MKIDDTSDVTLIGPDHSIGRIHAMDIHKSGSTDNIVPSESCIQFCSVVFTVLTILGLYNIVLSDIYNSCT